MSTLKTHKLAYIEALWDSGAIKIAHSQDELFQQRNGNKTWIFADHGDVILQPSTFLPVVEAMSSYLENYLISPATVLMNIVSKSSPQLTGALAHKLALPQICIISNETAVLEKGTNRQIRVPTKLPQLPKKIVIIDDILTTGKTVLETVALLSSLPDSFLRDANIHLLVCLARLPEEASTILRKSNITSHWIATLDEIVSYGWNKLSPTQQNGLLAEIPHLKNLISI